MKKVLFLFLLLFFVCPIFVLAEQIDINSATLSQLDQLTGIGPKYAQAIIDGRPFSSVDDLLRVKGIGEKTLQKIKDQGLACVNCSSAPETQQTPQAPQAPQTQQAKITMNTTDSTDMTKAITAPETIIAYPNGVFINEILPNPAGADEAEEWFELFNSNAFEVDLSGWKIKDASGTVSTFKIPAGEKILAKNFLVFKRPETKIMLNNDQDGLVLFTPDNKIVDSINYTNAPLNRSFNKTSSNWQWSLSLTPGSANITITLAKAPSASAEPNGLSKAEKSDTNNAVEAGLANLSAPNRANPWFLFFIALAITLISAISVLFIKLKLLNKNP